MKTIYLVRHGQTEGNATGKIGSSHDPLSPLGHKQAYLIGKRLKRMQFDAIIASPYTRAQQTALTIAKHQQAAITDSPLFAEVKMPSVLEGTLYQDPATAEIRRLRDENWGNPAWHHSDEENFFDVNARVTKALTLLKEHPAETILVVTHGAFSRGIAQMVLLGELLTPEITTALYPGLRMVNTGITILKENENGTWRLDRWNDSDHLPPEFATL